MSYMDTGAGRVGEGDRGDLHAGTLCRLKQPWKGAKQRVLRSRVTT